MLICVKVVFADEITLKLSRHAVFCLKIVTFAAQKDAKPQI